MFLDDADANAKTKARAFAHRLGRIERIENAIGVLESRTRVGEKDDHVAAVTNCLDGEDAAFGGFHGFQGVADDVEENLHQLISVSANAREDGFELHLDTRIPGTQVERTKLHPWFAEDQSTHPWSTHRRGGLGRVAALESAY